jgi:hypothetical protein
MRRIHGTEAQRRALRAGAGASGKLARPALLRGENAPAGGSGSGPTLDLTGPAPPLPAEPA